MGGGIFKLVFDTVPSDINGTGPSIQFTGGGINILAASAQGNVIQDAPAHGGLGVYGNTEGNSDNLETALGETLLLTFSRSFEVVHFTFNGLLGSHGHTDAADGDFTMRFIGGSLSGFDDVFDSDIASEFFDVTSLLFGEDTLSGTSGTPFKGYLESVTIKVSPVPLPARFAMLALGLGGVAAVARMRRKAA